MPAIHSIWSDLSNCRLYIVRAQSARENDWSANIIGYHGPVKRLATAPGLVTSVTIKQESTRVGIFFLQLLKVLDTITHGNRLVIRETKLLAKPAILAAMELQPINPAT